MAKKEAVDIVRNDEFEAVNEDLAKAMESLDEANQRIQDLLSSGTVSFVSAGGEGVAELDDEMESPSQPANKAGK
ncbi:MAG: hypothetical protein HYV27_04385 [Candidatus Hydrogenedentes bacterium]|nr:hypothetical protein [Candidatus Hydrogenedentota bacterium]